MKLEIGYHFDIYTRKHIYQTTGFPGLKIMYISDLHLNKHSKKLVCQVITAISKYKPNLILLGGDYIDFKPGFNHFEYLLNAIPSKIKVGAVAGNHDYLFGITRIEKLLEKYDISWIEKQSVSFTIGKSNVQIDGNCITRSPQINANCLRILCLHKPLNLPSTNDYHFAFAGHLHGSQCVFWQNKHGLFPGKLFYKWNILHKTIGQCEYFISRGLGDTLPIRYNCKREIILVETHAHARTLVP